MDKGVSFRPSPHGVKKNLPPSSSRSRTSGELVFGSCPSEPLFDARDLSYGSANSKNEPDVTAIPFAPKLPAFSRSKHYHISSLFPPSCV